MQFDPYWIRGVGQGDDVTNLLAIADPLFIFHLFCLVFLHTWFSFPNYIFMYTLCFPHVFVRDCFYVPSVRYSWFSTGAVFTRA